MTTQIIKSIPFLKKRKDAQKKKEQQEAMRQFMAIPLEPGDITIDCGANVGLITELLARSGATVYAFEPNPYAFSELKKKFTGKTNVICLNKGVFDENSTMKLFFHEKSEGNELGRSQSSSFMEEKRNISKDNYSEIEVVDLSEFIKSQKQRIKIVKMDIEGAECRVINKMIADGSLELVDNMFVETHDYQIKELRPEMKKIRLYLKKNGYTNINFSWT
jgi:FkbM family methyltransferase